MIYRPLGNTGITSSVIGLGTWNIGNQWGELDDATAYSTVQTAIECGVNLLDTAESYGMPQGLSEKRVGKALAGIRHKVSLVTKIGNWGKETTGLQVPLYNAEMIELCCHASLHRLRTDYIDVYLCHLGDLAPERTDTFLEGFELLKKQGLIRAYGISTDDPEVLRRFNKNGTCQVVEVEYSMLSRGPEDNGILDYARENNMGVLIRAPLAKGFLAGKYNRETVFKDSVRARWNADGPNRDNFFTRMDKLDKIMELVPREEMAETAIRFAASHPSSPVAIPGAKSAEQARFNAGVGDRVFTVEELAKFDAVK